MVTKREFLAGSAAIVAAGALVRPGTQPPPAVSAPTPMPAQGSAPALASERFDVVVYNGLFREAREFAAAQVANGAIALELAGDAGVLWYGTLRQLARGGRRRIAGMGTHTDLFILETLGRDERLKMSQTCRRDCEGPRLVSWVLEQKA